MKPYGIIYKITNKVNGKIYVGQTTRSMDVRWGSHARGANRTGVFDRAIRLYGKDNFFREEIATAFDQDELDRMERLFIVEFDSRVPAGYNVLPGGSGYKEMGPEQKRKISVAQKGRHPSSRRVTCLDLASGIERSYLSMNMAVLDGFDRNIIRGCCCGKFYHHRLHRWKWSADLSYPEIDLKRSPQDLGKLAEASVSRTKSRSLANTPRKVAAVNVLTGERLVFQTIVSAKALGFTPNCISKCLNGWIGQYRGYVWMDAGEE